MTGQRIDVDLTFHSPGALDAALGEAGAPPGLRQADGRAVSGWPILAQFGEYAHADLHGLHLTGWIRGHLLTDFDERLHHLAQHADGTLHGIAEDGSRWVTRLSNGTVIDHTPAEIPDRPSLTRIAGESGAAVGHDAEGPTSRIGRIELHVAHGLPRIAAIPWIRAHLEELRPHGTQAGSITLTGVNTLDVASLRVAAPDAAWQAFCNPDTATPNKWTGYHPAAGTVEAHHVHGQILVPRRGSALRSTGSPGSADHLRRLTRLLHLLDDPTSPSTTTLAATTRARDPLAGTETGRAPRPALDAHVTSAR